MSEKHKELLAKIVIIFVYGIICLAFIATVILMFTAFSIWLLNLLGGGM